MSDAALRQQTVRRVAVAGRRSPGVVATIARIADPLGMCLLPDVRLQAIKAPIG